MLKQSKWGRGQSREGPMGPCSLRKAPPSSFGSALWEAKWWILCGQFGLELVSFIWKHQVLTLHWTQMRAGHGSKKQSVERSKPVIPFLWGCQCTDWAKQNNGVIRGSQKQGITGGWPGKPSVVEKSTKACFLRRKGDTGLERRAEGQGKPPGVFHGPWQAAALNLTYHGVWGWMISPVFLIEGGVCLIRPRKSRPEFLEHWWTTPGGWMGLKITIVPGANPLAFWRPPPSPSFSLRAVIGKEWKALERGSQLEWLHARHLGTRLSWSLWWFK